MYPARNWNGYRGLVPQAETLEILLSSLDLGDDRVSALSDSNRCISMLACTQGYALTPKYFKILQHPNIAASVILKFQKTTGMRFMKFTECSFNSKVHTLIL